MARHGDFEDSFFQVIQGVIEGHEEESARLARELEDKTGQLLANAIYEVASCNQLIESDGETVKKGLVSLQAELEYGLQDLRILITELAPSAMIGNFGLIGGLRRYLDKFQEKTGIKTGLQTDITSTGLPITTKVTVFRVIQEALQNVEKHAGVSHVEVTVNEKEEGRRLVFTVKDNGRVVEPDDRDRRLPAMYARSTLLGGELSITTEDDQGTQVIFSVPNLHTLSKTL